VREVKKAIEEGVQDATLQQHSDRILELFHSLGINTHHWGWSMDGKEHHNL